MSTNSGLDSCRFAPGVRCNTMSMDLRGIGAALLGTGVGAPMDCPTTCTTVVCVARRQKRSISLPSDLADAIDTAATAAGTTVSAWMAETASHRLRLDAGRRGVAEWEHQHGALSPDEIADGLARARAMLRRPSSRKTA